METLSVCAYVGFYVYVCAHQVINNDRSIQGFLDLITCADTGQ